MLHSVFSEFALLLLISAAAGALSLWLRQPVLIAYIVVGIVAGPAVLGVVTAHDQIDLLAQVGVAVLLFVVGLKLDLQHIRHIGPVALATGLGQLASTITAVRSPSSRARSSKAWRSNSWGRRPSSIPCATPSIMLSKPSPT